MHFDEGVHWDYFVRKISIGEPLTYYPNFHGFTSWYLSAIPVFFIENSIVAMRVAVAIAGSLIVAFWWFLKNGVGRFGMLVSGAFMAISPTFIYYGRHVAQHTYFVLFTLIVVLSVFAYLRTLKNRYFYLSAFVSALLYTTHGFSMLFFAILVSFAGVAYYFTIDATRTTEHFRRIARAFSIKTFIIGLLIFAFVVTAVMSSFFADMSGLSDFVRNQISSSEFQKTFNTGHNKPFLYYIKTFLPIESFAFLGFALYFFFFRRTYFSMFTLYWTLVSLFVFSIIPYKIPWLFIIVLLPMYVLSGITIDEILKRTRQNRIARFFVCAILSVLIVYTGYLTVLYNYILPTAYARENPLNYVGPVNDSYRFISDLKNVAGRIDNPRILIGTNGVPESRYYLNGEYLKIIPDDVSDLNPFYSSFDIFVVPQSASYDSDMVKDLGLYEIRERYFVRLLISAPQTGS